MRVSTSRNQAESATGGGVAAEVAADKHPVMAAYGDGAQGAFAGIVVDRHRRPREASERIHAQPRFR